MWSVDNYLNSLYNESVKSPTNVHEGTGKLELKNQPFIN